MVFEPKFGVCTVLHSLCTHNQIIEAVSVWMLCSLSEPWAQSPAPGRKIKVIIVPAKKQIYLQWNLLYKILQLYVRMCSSGMFVEETDHPTLGLCFSALLHNSLLCEKGSWSKSMGMFMQPGADVWRWLQCRESISHSCCCLLKPLKHLDF